MSENISKPNNELVLQKHVDFIVNYGKTHEKYVNFEEITKQNILNWYN